MKIAKKLLLLCLICTCLAQASQDETKSTIFIKLTENINLKTMYTDRPEYLKKLRNELNNLTIEDSDEWPYQTLNIISLENLIREQKKTRWGTYFLGVITAPFVFGIYIAVTVYIGKYLGEKNEKSSKK